MSFRLDILSEDGISRLCTLNNKEMNIKTRTPSPVLPITDFLLKDSFYLNILQTKDIIFAITSLEQKIPGTLENNFLFYYPTTNYYFSENQPEPIVSTPPNKKFTYFFSKTCPSTFLDDDFAIEWYSQFFKEIIDEIENNTDLLQKLKGFGIVLNFQELRNPDILLNLIESYASNPLIYDNIVSLKIVGLFDKKMDYISSVDLFIRLRSMFPADVLFIASGKILPYEYAFLINLGFDAIDMTYLLYAGYSGSYLFHEERMEWVRKLNSLEDYACMCVNCGVVRELFTESNHANEDHNFFNHIAFHNLHYGLVEIERIRKNIKIGSFSTYLERKSAFSLFLLSALRHIRKNHKKTFNSIQTLDKSAFFPCTSPLTYHNPNIAQYKEKLRNNVEPRPNTKICIFLPCSMVKPYSKSKSHRNFRKIIKNAAMKWYKYFSEVIITSPLGVVPRELEEVFPVQHYDISVTGDWDAEELQLTAEDIIHWINKLSDDVKIIAYLHGGYRQAFEMALRELEKKGRNLDYSIPRDIDEFTHSIDGSIEAFSSHENNGRIKDSLSSEEHAIKMIADFQFGFRAGLALIGSTARFLQSRNDNLKTIIGFESYGKLQLGRYYRNSGRIQLNYQGGQRLSKIQGITVTLNTLDVSGTTIFKPGIAYLDEALCAGDEVIILGPEKQYLGVGALVVSSNTFSRMRRGAVVKIRKMKKGGT